MAESTMPSPAPATRVCFAVPEEQKVFRKSPPPGVDILVTGMGALHARTRFLDSLTRSRPGRVLTCGFAGALDPRWRVGDVLFDLDPGLPLSEKLLRAGAHPARFHCATSVAVLARDKQQLHRSTGADAVEMESGILRALCREHGIPSGTLRVISDAADQDLPLDFNAVMTPDQRMDPWKFAGHLLRHPGVIPGLLRLQRHCALAAQRLADTLHAALR